MPDSQIIGIDFDGTIVEHAYPDIGAPVPGALETMKDLIEAGHRIILWTMRSGDTLAQAQAYCESHGITFYGINENPDQSWSFSPKAYCHVYIDNAALGCPLIRKFNQRPMVYWPKVREFLEAKGLLTKARVKESG